MTQNDSYMIYKHNFWVCHFLFEYALKDWIPNVTMERGSKRRRTNVRSICRYIDIPIAFLFA